MSGDGSFFSIFVDDPRWELGAILLGVAALIWYREGAPGGLNASAFLIAGFGLPGVIAFLLALREAAAASRLARSGMEARGRVTGIARVWPRTYALRYSFRDNLGAEVHGRRFVSQTDAFDWRDGDEGPVRFEMGNPSRNVWLGMPNFERLPSAATAEAAPRAAATLPSESTIYWRSRNARYAFVLLFAFYLAAAILAAMTLVALNGGTIKDDAFVYVAILVTGFLAIGLYKLRQGKREAAEGARILREGAPAKAVVIAIDEERIRGRMGISMSVGWMVSYSYEDSAGGTHWGKSGFLTEREATRWRTGERCPVWFDPRNPDASVWAG